MSRGEFQAVTGAPYEAFTADGRRLVVIDPEDREQVERLRSTIRDLVSHLQLREALDWFVSPPRPEEPTGLGAVVEDDWGRRWVRWSDQHEYGWQLGDDPHTSAFAYANIAAVRVLSEGATP